MIGVVGGNCQLVLQIYVCVKQSPRYNEKYRGRVILHVFGGRIDIYLCQIERVRSKVLFNMGQNPSLLATMLT
jgi:hypothetical protein